MFYVFFETDGDYGKYKRAYGFRTDAARRAWVKNELAILAWWGTSDDLSDLEEWEAPESEWAHVRILEG